MKTDQMSAGITVQIVDAIAEKKGVTPTDLDYTIQNHIETDVFELLADSNTEFWTLSFECPDGTVTVTQNGTIHVDIAEEAW